MYLKVHTMASSSEANSEVTIQDLTACVNLIDVCSRRGAFHGSELEAVGLLRRRLKQILDANAPPKSESDESAPDVSDAQADSSDTPREDAPQKRRKGKAKA